MKAPCRRMGPQQRSRESVMRFITSCRIFGVDLWLERRSHRARGPKERRNQMLCAQRAAPLVAVSPMPQNQRMKDKFEEDAIARLIGHLNATRGGAFEI